MTDDLVAFLKARLDEDEQAAKAATSGRWMALDGGVMALEDESWPVTSTETECERDDRVHIARWDPARVLAEVQAKRRIIERHHEVIWTEWHDVRETACGHCSQPGGRRVAWPCPDVLDIAEVYGWAPEELA